MAAPAAEELTPLAKVIVVAEPWLTAAPVLLVTVGTAPLGAGANPLKVRLMSPLKPVMVLPPVSARVIVN